MKINPIYYDKDFWPFSPFPVLNIKKIDKEYNTTRERWKIVLDKGGYETNYIVSTHGRLFNTKTHKYMKLSSIGYNKRYVVFLIKSNVSSEFDRLVGAHRLVGESFIKIPRKYSDKGLTRNDLVINHIDGYKWHNLYTNLEWITQVENMKHAIETGLNSGIIGEKSHLAKMDNIRAIKCCEMLAKGMSTKEIADTLNVTKRSVQHIKDRESWTSISKNFTFPKNKKQIPNSIPIETIRKVCEEIATKKYSDREISEKYGMSREHVRDIRLRKTQTSISKDYQW